MASRDDLSKTVSKASEEYFEYECTPCANDGRNIEAVKCCLNCGEYFCSLCLKHHDRYTKHHRTAEPTSMTRPSRQSRHNVVMETCHLHNDNTIDTYCVIHDAVCCSTCVSLKHRACEGMEYIIDASRGVFKSKEYNDLPVMLDHLMDRIEKLKKVKKADQHNLGKEKTACLQLIDNTRHAINKRLDNLEQIAKDSIISKYVEMKDYLNQDVDDLDQMEDNMKISKDILEKNYSGYESQAFSRMKISENIRREGIELFSKIKLKQKRGFLKFEINSKFRDFLQKVETFGRPFEEYIDEKLPRASSTGKLNVKSIRSDTTVHSLPSFVRLPDREALIGDTANNKIKKIKSPMFTNLRSRPLTPYDMTNFSAEEKVAFDLKVKEVMKVYGGK